MQPTKTKDPIIKVSSWLLIVYSIIEIIIYLIFFILSKIAGKYLSGFIDQLATNYIDFAFHEQVSKFASSWTINLILDSFVFTTEIFLLFSIIRIITAILILKQKKVLHCANNYDDHLGNLDFRHSRYFCAVTYDYRINRQYRTFYPNNV
ncbi:hypothetical protein PWEIH_02267 [Listeria weihenstephanensis FSL R9-0317]|uniref:hypothetical protein n=1 Tax=Listeria weihenstephanensis TaxID=1006155 RepID=UPI0003E8BF86|nr:hypothetical protein [Listeria weihenstephanensis]EUJ41093.1 hypothetical protein PWEIH_02267 [Listeria weihenstephanensis FSL R9-0317]